MGASSVSLLDPVIPVSGQMSSGQTEVDSGAMDDTPQEDKALLSLMRGNGGDQTAAGDSNVLTLQEKSSQQQPTVGDPVEGSSKQVNLTASADIATESAEAVAQPEKDSAANDAYVPPPFDSSAHPTLNDHQLSTLAVLSRHSGELKKFKAKDIDKMIASKDTPADMKQALTELKNDPTLLHIMDTGGGSHTDGLMSNKDLAKISQWPEVKAFNEKQATSYGANYMPSDAEGEAATGTRPITKNDAMRELFLYSDTLKSPIDQAQINGIIDGSMRGKKCPPQVIAAAKYFKDHPDEWTSLAPAGTTTVPNLLSNISKNVYLTDDESATVKIIQQNKDVFFKDKLDDKKLKDIAANGTEEQKTAANKLLKDPLLFGMIDNGSRGYKYSKHYSVDNRKADLADFDAFTSNLTTLGKQPPALPPLNKFPTAKSAGADGMGSVTGASTDPAAASAMADMQQGWADDPAVKTVKKKPSGWQKFLHALAPLMKVLSPVIKVFEKIYEYVGIALATIGGFIPGVGVILEAAGTAMQMAGAAMKAGRQILTGGDVKEVMKGFGEAAGIAVATGVAGAVLPGAGRLVVTGIKAGVKGATTAGKVATKVGVESAEVGAKASAKALPMAEAVAIPVARIADDGFSPIAAVATKGTKPTINLGEHAALPVATRVEESSVQVATRVDTPAFARSSTLDAAATPNAKIVAGEADDAATAAAKEADNGLGKHADDGVSENKKTAEQKARNEKEEDTDANGKRKKHDDNDQNSNQNASNSVMFGSPLIMNIPDFGQAINAVRKSNGKIGVVDVAPMTPNKTAPNGGVENTKSDVEISPAVAKAAPTAEASIDLMKV